MRIVEICKNPGRDTLQVKTTSAGRRVVDPALAWSQGLSVEVGGAGTVAAAGVVLPRLLADRLGLTDGLAAVVARAGFVPLRHRGRALVDATCALAAGATCLSDVEAMTAQEEIFGPGGGVIRLDATLIEAASPKAQAAGTYKGGYGFHPLTGWCSNIGDALAVMQRPGNAGSFTAADHLAVLEPRSPRSRPPGAPTCWSASTARAPPTT